ncbi:MAG: T3SS effector HopA1 family protein [Solirubrobacteraceae bacterium]
MAELLTDWQRALVPFLAELAWEPGGAWRWFDVTAGRATRRLAEHVDRLELARWRTGLLAEIVYEHLYVSGFALPQRRSPLMPSGADTPEPVRDKIASLARSPVQSRGWIIKRVEPDHVIAARDGLTARIGRSRIDRCETHLRPGRAISIAIPAASVVASPGFVTFFSSEDVLDAMAAQPVIRLYFNVPWRHRLTATRAVLACFDSERLSHATKVLVRNDRERRDTMVTYLAAGDATSAIAAIGSLFPAAGRLLRPGAPLWTREVWAGVAVAEDPTTFKARNADAISFGSHRSQLVAEGIASHRAARRRRNTQMESVLDAFQQAEVVLAEPWRMSHSDWSAIDKAIARHAG